MSKSSFDPKEYLERRTKCMKQIPAVPGIYLISFENGHKFGMSGNLKKRIRSYFNPWAQKIQYVKIWQADQSTADLVYPGYKESWRQRQLAGLLERRSLACIPDRNRHGEYIINLDRERIIAIIHEQKVQIRSEAIYKLQLADEKLKEKLNMEKLNILKRIVRNEQN